MGALLVDTTIRTASKLLPSLKIQKGDIDSKHFGSCKNTKRVFYFSKFGFDLAFLLLSYCNPNVS